MIFKIRNKENAKSLFIFNKYDTVLISSALNGYSGTIYVNSLENPTIGRIDTGAFTIFGGNPESPECIEFIRVAPIYYTTPENNLWAIQLKKEYGGRIKELPFVEYSPDTINLDDIRRIIKSLGNDFELNRINTETANRVIQEIRNEYFLENFSSPADFYKRGIGFCIKHNNRIVSAATSMAASDNAIDVEIETIEEYRNMGLDTIVGAKLVEYCLMNDIIPKWLAANMDSERLAVRLGYSKGRKYVTYQIKY